MRSPVHFISLEKELEPVTGYLQGKVLNAGCGSRDITSTLLACGATSLDNCDIATDLPGAFTCDLHAIPKPDASYDAILCNAVLEHIRNPDAVMREFHRLLVVGGHLIISIPFLQPYHPCPTDYQRYTVAGMEELAQKNGFAQLAIRPVHSIAQTIGWICWAHAEAKGNKIWQYLLWPIIYSATRIWNNSNTIVASANAFQAVLKKN